MFSCNVGGVRPQPSYSTLKKGVVGGGVHHFSKLCNLRNIGAKIDFQRKVLFNQFSDYGATKISLYFIYGACDTIIVHVHICVCTLYM